MAAMQEKDTFGGANSFQPQSNGNGLVDKERQASTSFQGRKMSRIGPPVEYKRAGGASDSDDDAHNRLVNSEADNAIQYRTCSWQKVRHYTQTLLCLTTLVEYPVVFSA